ncbi:MAG: hypothetical protein ACYTFG_07635, partial [Planctomycetota bacterium]
MHRILIALVLALVMVASAGCDKGGGGTTPGKTDGVKKAGEPSKEGSGSSAETTGQEPKEGPSKQPSGQPGEPETKGGPKVGDEEEDTPRNPDDLAAEIASCIDKLGNEAEAESATVALE